MDTRDEAVATVEDLVAATGDANVRRVTIRMAKTTIADQLVEILAAAGVRRVYGVVGDSLNGITDATRRRQGIDWSHVRHEATAARGLVERFHHMMRQSDRKALPGWIMEAAGSLLSFFVKGLATDHAAVAAALTESWSNSQTKDRITRLKLVRR